LPSPIARDRFKVEAGELIKVDVELHDNSANEEAMSN
jgi:hypothetical protein